MIDGLITPPSSLQSLGIGPPPVPHTGKMYVGGHVSGAAGLWKAFERADDYNCKSFAIFLRNRLRWEAKPLD